MRPDFRELAKDKRAGGDISKEILLKHGVRSEYDPSLLVP